MATYLFVTKPEYEPEQVVHGHDLWWSCSSTTEIGDIAFVYVTGVGLCYVWEVIEDARRHKEWRFICDVRYLKSFEPVITIKELREAIPREVWAPPHQGFRGFQSIRVPPEVEVMIRRLRELEGESIAVSAVTNVRQ